jgi:hypothetical protein
MRRHRGRNERPGMNGRDRIVEVMEEMEEMEMMEGMEKVQLRKDWERCKEWNRWQQWESEHHKRSWKHQERFLIEMDQMAEMKKKRACLGMVIFALRI